MSDFPTEEEFAALPESVKDYLEYLEVVRATAVEMAEAWDAIDETSDDDIWMDAVSAVCDLVRTPADTCSICGGPLHDDDEDEDDFDIPEHHKITDERFDEIIEAIDTASEQGGLIGVNRYLEQLVITEDMPIQEMTANLFHTAVGRDLMPSHRLRVNDVRVEMTRRGEDSELIDNLLNDLEQPEPVGRARRADA